MGVANGRDLQVELPVRNCARTYAHMRTRRPAFSTSAVFAAAESTFDYSNGHGDGTPPTGGRVQRHRDDAGIGTGTSAMRRLPSGWNYVPETELARTRLAVQAERELAALEERGSRSESSPLEHFEDDLGGGLDGAARGVLTSALTSIDDGPDPFSVSALVLKVQSRELVPVSKVWMSHYLPTTCNLNLTMNCFCYVTQWRLSDPPLSRKKCDCVRHFQQTTTRRQFDHPRCAHMMCRRRATQEFRRELVRRIPSPMLRHHRCDHHWFLQAPYLQRGTTN